MGVLTGAIAIIKYRGQAVGFMRNVTINESYQRAEVGQLGSIFSPEAPVTKFSGTLSCGFYEIDFKSSGIPDAVKRKVQNNTQFENNIVLDVNGVQIDVYKREADVVDEATGNITPKETPYATIKRALIESDSVNIQEQTTSGRDQSFRYLDPVIRSN